ncbi:MAG TPA: biotin transporter BioY [Candidatus Saccharimonadales bacterium]|nr:biotin transporter BioY [Candidatus Saccharimonadales bacterium]
MLAHSRPLALAAWPGSLLWQAVLVVAGSALIALGAQIAVPLPFSPVPVTGQTFAVLIVATSLGRLGVASVLLYILEGAIGLPVFAGGAFGIARLVGPTGGYLVGFVVAALVLAWYVDRGLDRRVGTAIVAMLSAEAAIYACGVVWLSRFPLTVSPLQAGLYPFIPGDLLKLAAAGLLLPTAWRIVRR